MATASHRSHPSGESPDRGTVVVRWSARILALAGLAFLLFLFAGHLFAPAPVVEDVPITFGEAMGFVWMGLLLIGYVVGWWRPLLGGALAVGSMAAFYAWFSILRGGFLAMGVLVVLAIPGVLYLIEAWLARRMRLRGIA